LPMRSATPSSGATTMPARSVTTRHDRLHIRGAGPRTLVTRDLPIAITRGRNRSRFITLFRARRRLSPHRRSRRLPQARAGAFASDIGSNCSVHPRYDDRIRRPVSSSISLTHAPLHHVQLHRTPSLSDATGDFLHCLDNFRMVGLAGAEAYSRCLPPAAETENPKR